jgi:hypothetical protein
MFDFTPDTFASFAPLREKNMNYSRQCAKHAKMYGARANKPLKFSARPAPLRENSLLNLQQGWFSGSMKTDNDCQIKS